MEVNNHSNIFNTSLTTFDNPNIGDTTKSEESQNTQQTQNTSPTNIIMTNLLDVISSVTGGDITGNSKNLKSTDPTSLSNIMLAPEDEAILENLDKLIALLQMETSEEQLKLAHERISMLKDQIEARCQQQLEEIGKSCEDLSKQLEDQKKAKALRWLSALLGIFAALVTCLTLGAAGPFAVALCCVAVVTAVVTLVDTIMQECGTSLAGEIQKGIEKLLKAKGKDPQEAEKIAQGIMIGFQVAMAVASLVCCIGQLCTGNVAVVSKAAIILNGLLTMGQGSLAIGSAVNSYNIAQSAFEMTMAQVELLQIKKILERLEKMMDEEQETVQEITKMLQSNIAVLRNLLESEAKITDYISDNMGMMQA